MLATTVPLAQAVGWWACRGDNEATTPTRKVARMTSEDVSFTLLSLDARKSDFC